MALQWGIIAPGGIVEEVSPFVFYDGGVNAIRAVASRNLDKAKAFAEKFSTHGPVKAYGSYEELIADPDVQAVYLATPTIPRKILVEKCAAAGKHVLAEKPLCPTANEVEEMIQKIKGKGLQFLDATHFVHHPRTHAITQVLRDQSLLGHVTDVTSSFIANLPETPTQIRFMVDQEPLGALGDLGWYNLKLTFLAFDNLQPESVVALTTPASPTNPAIMSMTVVLKFPDLHVPNSKPIPRTARFVCGFNGSSLVQSVVVQGTKAAVEWSDFVHPWSYVARRKNTRVLDTKTYPLEYKICKRAGHVNAQVVTVENADAAGVDYLFRRFKRAVDEGGSAPDITSMLQADVLVHRTIDACIESRELGGVPVDFKGKSGARM
ncbi:NAD(P)-binding protein [Gonapodya prolifera JEL478]|uniref:NAD(P)-binding protein n=1 Tax=Gonapodya prolifera (strain JEL478) TaxID=1344416 RepID=A0A139B005_GONPJ|nr:NAD(P)-binding protein [Gonapodya prolifera JEL478]|eukprot:KXS22328.1 NAD(P)-binding protein [Gonapodya prolifera JEL478]